MALLRWDVCQTRSLEQSREPGYRGNAASSSVKNSVGERREMERGGVGAGTGRAAEAGLNDSRQIGASDWGQVAGCPWLKVGRPNAR